MSRRTKKQHTSADEVSLVIDAPADRLYDIVSDVSKMGRLSPECTGGKWLGGATGPAVGARFKGHNRRGWARWSTTNRVVAANRGREFAFETLQSGARWGYRFDPTGDATTVTESHEMFRRRPAIAWVYATLMLGGAKEHDDEVKAGMRTSLERLKAVAETPEPVALTGRKRRKARKAAKAERCAARTARRAA